MMVKVIERRAMSAALNVSRNDAFKYKGFGCVFNKETQEWDVYTPEEMEQPKRFRNVDISCSTAQQCKEFIDSY